MAKNEVLWDANRISVPVGAGCLSGDPVRVGVLNAVAVTDGAVSNDAGSNMGYALTTVGSVNHIPTGNEVNWASVKASGSWRIPVVAAGAVAVGDPIYAIVNGTASVKKVTLTATVGTNKLWGIAMEPIAGAGTVSIAVKVIEFTTV